MAIDWQDHLSIQNILVRMVQASDFDADISAWEEHWAPHAQLERAGSQRDLEFPNGPQHNTAVLDGLDAIRSHMDEHAQLNLTGRGVRHYLTNHQVTETNSGLLSRCYFLFVDSGAAGRVIATGRYHDRFERIDGTWKIVHRLCEIDPLDSE